MTEPDLSAPEARAAISFMEYKGYRGAAPLGVDVVEADDPLDRIWYFYFEVPEGLIELEVDYGVGRDGRLQWWCQVVGFLTYDTEPEGWTPVGFVHQHIACADRSGG